jgi:hypothetical protein
MFYRNESPMRVGDESVPVCHLNYSWLTFQKGIVILSFRIGWHEGRWNANGSAIYGIFTLALDFSVDKWPVV